MVLRLPSVSCEVRNGLPGWGAEGLAPRKSTLKKEAESRRRPLGKLQGPRDLGDWGADCFASLSCGFLIYKVMGDGGGEGIQRPLPRLLEEEIAK